MKIKKIQIVYIFDFPGCGVFCVVWDFTESVMCGRMRPKADLGAGLARYKQKDM